MSFFVDGMMIWAGSRFSTIFEEIQRPVSKMIHDGRQSRVDGLTGLIT
jgi:hypothetical protein